MVQQKNYKMKNIPTLIALLFFTTVTSFTFAQKESKKTHENHYRKLDPIETDEYKIVITDAHSQAKFTSMRITITNKTSDYLVYRPSEVVFKYEHGDFKVEGKEIMIKPNGTINKILKVSGGKQFHVKTLSVEADCFYLLSVDKEVINAPDFDLPASINDFKAGSFEVSLKKLSKETRETVAQFIVTYTGSEYGILTNGKTAVRLEDKREFASRDSNRVRSKILKPGEERKLTIIYTVPANITDMQFANMKIIWKGTFAESKAVKLTGQTFSFVIDPGLTEGKNN